MRNPFISLGDQSIRYDLIVGFKLTKLENKDKIMVFLCKSEKNALYDAQNYYICDWIFFTMKDAKEKIRAMEVSIGILTDAYGIPMGSKVSDEN